MSIPPGNSDGDAALLALLIVLGARLIDHIAPKGWHLKIIRFWAERDDDDNEDSDNAEQVE